MKMNLMNANETDPGFRLTERGTYEWSTLVFYPEDLTLWKDGKRIRMPYESAVLLRAFLQAPRGFLPQEKLYGLLWTDEQVSFGKAGALSMAVSRLRKTLSIDKRIRLDCQRKIGYELRIVE